MKLRLHLLLIFTGILLSLNTGCNSSPASTKSYDELSDEEKRMIKHATAGLEVADGLEATLFAAENTFLNPTNIDIDPQGRIWVCEAFNYRNHLNPNNPVREEGDRILILEDTDGDGVSDKSKVFYQGTDINAALGIAVIGNRVFVSVSPNVFVFTDEDGDDMPDKKELLYTGMEGVQHDHGVHAFVFGPDGKLYFNFGNEGKRLQDAEGNLITDKYGYPIEAVRKPFQQGMVFRTEQDGSNVEVVAWNFRNNYEVAVDAFGALWQSDNDDDGNQGVRINYLMEFGNYGRNDEMTGAGWRKFRTGMSDEIPLRHWHLNDPGVVPNLLQTGAGSPTGIAVYEGDLLPERFHNQIIHCDAGPNVVRAYPVENDGAGYKASVENLVQGRDNWFRPSDVCVAPDGSVFIADWYDPGVGGHQMGDTTRGRIYRIAPPNTDYKFSPPDFSTAEGAAEALKSPNNSTRASAWMALHEMGTGAEAALKTLWESDNPRYRARALWLLSALPDMGKTYLDAAISDENANIRMAGLRAARQTKMDLSGYMQQLSKDPDPQVRREVAVALRNYQGADKGEIWTTLALEYPIGDRWYLEALGIGSNPQPDQVFETWLVKVGEDWRDQGNRDIVWRVRAKKAIPMLGELIASAGTAEETRRYFRAMDFHTDPSKNRVLAELLGGNHPDPDQIAYLSILHMNPEFVMANRQVKSVLNEILAARRGSKEYLDLVEGLELKSEAGVLAELAVNKAEEEEGRRAAQLIRDFGKLDLLADMLEENNESRQIAAMIALNNAGSGKALDLIQNIVMDDDRPNTLRRAAIQYLGRGWNGENRLADMLKNKSLPPDLEKAAATQLLSVYRESYRELAAEILQVDQAETSLPPMNTLLAQSGNAAEGQSAFGKYCQTCHVVNGEGVDFGPNLSEIGNKLSRPALYASIMNPSAGISFGYEAYLFTLNDESKILGYIYSETDEKVDVKIMGGTVRSLSKADIISREMQEQSLMTEGLYKAMSARELISLIEYLGGLGKEAGV